MPQIITPSLTDIKVNQKAPCKTKFVHRIRLANFNLKFLHVKITKIHKNMLIKNRIWHEVYLKKKDCVSRPHCPHNRFCLVGYVTSRQFDLIFITNSFTLWSLNAYSADPILRHFNPVIYNARTKIFATVWRSLRAQVLRKVSKFVWRESNVPGIINAASKQTFRRVC